MNRAYNCNDEKDARASNVINACTRAMNLDIIVHSFRHTSILVLVDAR